MTQKITLTFEGVKPTPQGRPRFSFVTHHAYDSKGSKDYKRVIRLQAMAQLKNAGWSISGKPLSLCVQFLMPIPKSKTKKFKIAAIDGKIKHVVKPDLDNLFKAAIDALNGLAYKDDNQIISVLMGKRYAENAGIIIKIEELE